jgi:hypothetical protein
LPMGNCELHAGRKRARHVPTRTDGG